jgi:DNA polymerase eta
LRSIPLTSADRTFHGCKQNNGARQESSGGISEREEQDFHMRDEVREAHSPFDVPPSAQLASDDTPKSHATVQSGHSDDEEDTSRYTCSRCNTTLLVTEQGEHDDWHFAKELAADLAAEERANTAVREQSRPASTSTSTQPKSKGRGRPPNAAKAEKGQKKLKFG